MCDRIRTAVDTRDQIDSKFVIMARTDAIANEGLDTAMKRMESYVQAGVIWS